MTRTIKYGLYHSIAPLLTGILIYLLFRSTDLIGYRWLNSSQLQIKFTELPLATTNLKNSLPLWIKFSLPDGLWMYALSSSYLALWKPQLTLTKTTLYLPLIAGLGIEFSQLFYWGNGTYDSLDLLFLILFYTLSLITYSIHFREKHTT